MGITLHYNGVLRHNTSLSDLIRDTMAVVKRSAGWGAHVFKETFPATSGHNADDSIYGMLFYAPESEPVYLTFDNNRQLRMWLFDSSEAKGIKRSTAADKQALKGAFTKTHYAGPEVHMRIVDLLRKLSEKYFEHFEMIDESGYWENRNATLLRERFGPEDTIASMLAQKLKAF
ncbi:MAG TPA: hypothetical protein VFW78_12570 [Bacteroidia bacterium]|nr:hypothetical protein [Bacteroidia bacterium]